MTAMAATAIFQKSPRRVSPGSPSGLITWTAMAANRRSARSLPIGSAECRGPTRDADGTDIGAMDSFGGGWHQGWERPGGDHGLTLS